MITKLTSEFVIFIFPPRSFLAMRVGRPVKPLPHPNCDYCGAPATLARTGDEAYPYRDDHGPLWICVPCQAWIGTFARSTRNVPLGRLANAQLRDLKVQLHAALEPLVQAKVRRDGCNVFEARSKGMKWLAQAIGVDAEKCSIHTLDAEQCERAIAIVAEFEKERGSHPSVSATNDR
jgi:hypothetical protein